MILLLEEIDLNKRVVGIYVIFILCFTVLIGRIYILTTGEALSQAAENQSKYTLKIGQSRGYIYDKNLVPLTNNAYSYKAAVIPSPESINAILQSKAYDNKDFLLSKLEDRTPFVIPVTTDEIYAQGVNVFKVINRYPQNQQAVHIIGHLNSEDDGIMGVEHAYNEYLKSYEGELLEKFTVNAVGEALAGENCEIIKDGYDDKHGVVLTLDTDIQRIVKTAAKGKIKTGAVVVMNVDNGDILAALSLPEFDPNDIEKDLKNEDKPFFNRIFAPTSVGSTFKLIDAACAFEKGINENQSFECKGFIQIEDVIYHCQNRNGHGIIDMHSAMQWSCNPYFINLAAKTGVQNIAHKASQIGFGRSYEIMPNHFTPSGYLPNYSELENVGEAANFSFGQGKLTASPVQICQMVSTMANGGKSVTPRIIEGFSNDGISVNEHTEMTIQNQIIEEDATFRVRKLMQEVVESGSGKKAKPNTGGAGGKTGSAQTGVFDENGTEKVQAWFTGFYPYQMPKYAIVVLAEGENSGGDVCAPIFKEICDNIALLS